MSEPATSNTLGVNVFTAPGKAVVGERPKPFGPPLGWDPITSTLIYGEYDAVLVDPLTTVAEASALAEWVGLHHRNLTTIYITHGHFDHFFGLSVLLDRFPDAKAIATPKSIELVARTDPELSRFFASLFPGQFPAKITLPQPYPDDTFFLEGNEIRIIEQGWTDTLDSTSLHVPSIDLVVGGDVLYNQCHMFVGDSTAESRANWIAALDRLADLNPKIAIAGHKKTGAPDTPDAIEGSKRYLKDFGRLKESALSDEDLYNEMARLYPDWVSHQSWLMFGFPLNTIPAS
ncbi:MBL fold metallo-hydrolase [Mycobacterium sp. Aquia_216]|uniref:MBL fold metallo-hydrolase n=1 Tax=Mycobacterium sp. Aquia_216 TaxID=2991729 RepID=UPI00227C8579|nr:MBL fold metallo-hydrolase [Mycobacterium sp. Aquia_216]WAJ43718.1 MBL fold metallo-hydrolase [Mycobacterium sp. Aquia_216]